MTPNQWADSQGGLTPIALAVLKVLAQHGQKRPVAWPSLRLICRWTSRSTTAIRTALRELEDRQLIAEYVTLEETTRRVTSSTYVLNLDSLSGAEWLQEARDLADFYRPGPKVLRQHQTAGENPVDNRPDNQVENCVPVVHTPRKVRGAPSPGGGLEPELERRKPIQSGTGELIWPDLEPGWWITDNLTQHDANIDYIIRRCRALGLRADLACWDCFVPCVWFESTQPGHMGRFLCPRCKRGCLYNESTFHDEEEDPDHYQLADPQPVVSP